MFSLARQRLRRYRHLDTGDKLRRATVVTLFTFKSEYIDVSFECFFFKIEIKGFD